MIIQDLVVTPIAFRDPPLLNADGVHEPLALRTIVELVVDGGVVGLGEGQGGEVVAARVASVRDAVVGLRVTDLHGIERVDGVSETAFVVPRGEGCFDLRWFTPLVEVDLCGHATLATTYALLDAGLLASGQTAQFSTRSGILKATPQSELIELDFAAETTSVQAVPEQLAASLGLGANEVLTCGRAGSENFVGRGGGVMRGGRL